MVLTSQFTLPEILSLLGLVQSVYVLVYMILRSGNVRSAIVPSLYFVTLSLAFLFDAAARLWSDDIQHYEAWQWLFWFAGVPLGALLIFQIAHITEPLRPRYFFLLLLIPVAVMPGFFLGQSDILYAFGLVIGTLSLLGIWLRRDLLDGLHNNPRFGEERFWLILSLIVLSAAFLGSTLAHISDLIPIQTWVLIRTLLGIAFVYLAATSLFRIYPQALRRDLAPPVAPNPADQKVLDRLKTLLDEEKIYQEATYGRAELAREIGVGEATLSRIVNVYYGKTIPQILNELRVRDAQRMLRETEASIQNIFEESGFNSITTFNRVFKELVGEAPKEYRARHRL